MGLGCKKGSDITKGGITEVRVSDKDGLQNPQLSFNDDYASLFVF